jgi:hypothetical protein
MPTLSDAVVIGIVLTLVFAAVSYYLYSRMVQAETKLGLLESILLNLKMATESSLFMSNTEAVPSPVHHVHMHKVNPENQMGDLQKMIHEAHAQQNDQDEQDDQNNQNNQDNQNENCVDENNQDMSSSLDENGNVEEKDVEFVPSVKPSASSLLHIVKDADGGSKVHIGFESMSWKELCAEAKKRNITGVSHMNRKKLIDVLNAREGKGSVADTAAWSNMPVTDFDEVHSSDLASIHEFPENASQI